MKDLSGKTKKLNVVADYFGKGMFTNLVERSEKAEAKRAD